MSWREAAAIGVAVAMLATARAEAQAPLPVKAGSDWLGKRVVQKARDFTLRDDKQAVAWDGKRLHVYRVQRIDGTRLRLVAEGKAGGPSGWAAADQVVPIDQAIDVLHRPAPGGPGGRVLLPHRAAIRTGAIEGLGDLFERLPFNQDPFVDAKQADRPVPPLPLGNKELMADVRLRAVDGDKALGDFLEAIRLDPKDASAYHGCGLIRSRKDEYDGAIDDFTRAIGLEPGNAKAHLHRGYAWGNKGEYDNAIADFTEAIRLGRELDRVNAYCYRSRAWSDKGQLDKAEADFNEAIQLDPKNAASSSSAATAGKPGASMTRPSPTTTRPSASIRKCPGLSREARPDSKKRVRPGHRRLRSYMALNAKDASYAWPCGAHGIAKACMRGPSPTTHGRSSSIRRTSMLTTIGAGPG